MCTPSLCGTILPCHPQCPPLHRLHVSPSHGSSSHLIGLTEGPLPLSTSPLPAPLSSRCRCIEEDAGLIDLEPLPGFPKGMELHKPADEPFDVKDIFSASLESEALKETLLRQAKTQVCLGVHVLVQGMSRVFVLGMGLDPQSIGLMFCFQFFTYLAYFLSNI